MSLFCLKFCFDFVTFGSYWLWGKTSFSYDYIILRFKYCRINFFRNYIILELKYYKIKAIHS